MDNEVQNIIKNDFALVTSHRRENILDIKSITNIISLLNSIKEQNVVFPMGYKTQEILKNSDLKLNDNIKVINPIGYLEFMYLLKNSTFVATDSGTVVEEACIMGVPSIQMRYSTERPEVYDVKASVNSSKIIVEDLIELCNSNDFKKHKPSDYSFDISNSFKE